MKKSLTQIATLAMIGLLVFSSAGIVAPPKAHAQWLTTDLGDIVENTFNVIENTATSLATTWEQLKGSVFDTIAVAIAKQLMMQITMSVVNWINTGFKGGPAFVQNPGQFFGSIADTVAGNFLASNSPLAKNLCSPFKVDVMAALALQMTGGAGGSSKTSPYACTLSSMINNTSNAIKGASINGFTAGDFRQGGWPAFLALTTVPANNPNGAFLQAQADLSVRIGNQTLLKQNQLNQGSGFLSWETCEPDPNAEYEYLDPTSDMSGQICSVQTPGSTILNALNKHLDVPIENLELANDMNAVINALFSQLVTQVLNNGLTSVSQPSQTGGSTYLQQIANSETTQTQALQSTTYQALSPFISNLQTIAGYDGQALTDIQSASSTLNSAIGCYTSILMTSAASSTQASSAQNQIDQIQQILAGTTTELFNQFSSAYNTDTTNMQFYSGLNSSISSAQSASDLSTTSQEIDQLMTSGNLPQAGDVQTSKNNFTSAEAEIVPIQTDASSRLAACLALTTSSTTPATASTTPLTSSTTPPSP